MNTSATTAAAEPAELPPDEQAVLDWCKIRLADLHVRSGVNCLQLIVTRYPDGTIDAGWVLHKNGACVIDQPTIADGLKALREKLEARP